LYVNGVNGDVDVIGQWSPSLNTHTDTDTQSVYEVIEIVCDWCDV